MFEVTKAEEEEKSTTSPPASPSPSAGTSSTSSTKPSALRVTIPSELQGVAYIQVLCQKGNFSSDCKLLQSILKVLRIQFRKFYKF